MTFKDFLDDLFLVVVLYRKKISDSETIHSISEILSDQSIDILVYDNSPEYNPDPASSLNNCRLHYIADNENSGVSKAYNQGAIVAGDMNKRWLLLCDQDTVFTLSFFREVYSAIDIHDPALAAPFLFSDSKLISPCGFIFNYGFALHKIPASGWNNFKGISVLNSGLLVKLDTFKELNGYNEEVFLDFSDFDFIKRFKKANKKFYLVDTALKHNLESSIRGNFNELRFARYCKSYRGAINNTFDLISLSLIVFLRTIKLSAYYTSMKPVQAFWKNFIYRKN
jgi:rhamnosyltransferase